MIVMEISPKNTRKTSSTKGSIADGVSHIYRYWRLKTQKTVPCFFDKAHLTYFWEKNILLSFLISTKDMCVLELKEVLFSK